MSPEWLVLAVMLLALLCCILGLIALWLAKQVSQRKPTAAYVGSVLSDALRLAERQGTWADVDALRYEVRQTLSEIDRLRHDPEQARLRATKPIRPERGELYAE